MAAGIIDIRNCLFLPCVRLLFLGRPVFPLHIAKYNDGGAVGVCFIGIVIAIAFTSFMIDLFIYHIGSISEVTRAKNYMIAFIFDVCSTIMPSPNKFTALVLPPRRLHIWYRYMKIHNSHKSFEHPIVDQLPNTTHKYPLGLSNFDV